MTMTHRAGQKWDTSQISSEPKVHAIRGFARLEQLGATNLAKSFCGLRVKVLGENFEDFQPYDQCIRCKKGARI